MDSAADVFVSYKAEDRSRLVPLVAALEADGFSVWWDLHIGGGANWRTDIEDHLDAAKCVIVAWSKRSIGPEGEFVRDEASRARHFGTYLPLRLDAVNPPLGFGEIQALPLQGWKGDRSDARYKRIVEAVRSRIAGEDALPSWSDPGRNRLSRRAVVGGGVAVAAVAGTGAWLMLVPEPANAKRIAVMPFVNLSGDPAQAYFSDGIAEELRGALSRMGLEVIGRSSSEAMQKLETKKAASKLDVAHILTGSVRRSPAMVRVNAQLVSGSDGVERWAQNYDRAPGDAIEIQTDIAANVARALSITLGPTGEAALTLGGTRDSAAQDFILQAWHLERESAYEADTLRTMLALIESAIARDPAYAVAHSSRSNVLRTVGRLEEAEAAARRAISLAPRLGWAYSALARLQLKKINIRGALRHLKRALALSPDHPDVLHTAVVALSYVADLEEALRLAERALALDPFYGRRYEARGGALYYLRRYPESLDAWRLALELAPDRKHVHGDIAWALILMGQPAEAQAELQAMPADDPARLTGEAFVAARTRDRAGAKRIIERMKQQFGTKRSYSCAKIYAQLGDKDRAFEELDAALTAKDSDLLQLKIDPFLDPIRPDSRYAALLNRLGFP